MKICPQCQKTYTDATLNFCLDDGTTLIQKDGADDLPQTVFVPPPRPTSPNQTFPTQSGQTEQNQGFGGQIPPVGQSSQSQSGWNAAPQSQFSMTPSAQSNSKTLIWVLGILGAVVLLCGGGFGLLVLIGMNNDDYGNNKTRPTASPSATRSDSTTRATGVTKASFNKLREGMTLKECNDIIGFAATEMTRNSGGGKVFTSVKWEGKDYAIITAVFKDDILTNKYEANLK